MVWSRGVKGQSCSTEPLISGIWHYLWIDSDRIELNYRTPADVQNLLGVGKEPTHCNWCQNINRLLLFFILYEFYKCYPLSLASRICWNSYPYFFSCPPQKKNKKQKKNLFILPLAAFIILILFFFHLEYDVFECVLYVLVLILLIVLWSPWICSFMYFINLGQFSDFLSSSFFILFSCSVFTFQDSYIYVMSSDVLPLLCFCFFVFLFFFQFGDAYWTSLRFTDFFTHLYWYH